MNTNTQIQENTDLVSGHSSHISYKAEKHSYLFFSLLPCFSKQFRIYDNEMTQIYYSVEICAFTTLASGLRLMTDLLQQLIWHCMLFSSNERRSYTWIIIIKNYLLLSVTKGNPIQFHCVH